MNEIQFLIYEADERIEVVVRDETIWATDVLRDYIQKGFKIDAERMKQGENVFGKDYFRELLETVRSIRASERRSWQQITDIFAEISYNYDRNSEITRMFYAEVQNKFRYAITGKTATEIVYKSVDRNKEHMGLKTWKHSPHGRILQSDVVVAKNYLTETEIRRLERNVSAYFDYVERLLEEAKKKAIEEYKEFNEHQKIDSDFDKEIRKIQGGI